MHSGARRNNKLATGQVDVKIYAASSQQKCMSGGTFCSQKYAIRPNCAICCLQLTTK